MLKKNDVIELNIDDITNLGFGVGRHEGVVVFVSGLVPGDVARVKVIKEERRYVIARCEALLCPSPRRTDSRCPISLCHSCAYKNITYSHEREIKREAVRGAFVKAGMPEVEIGDLTPSPLECGYRNKAQYPIARDRSGEYIIGFYAPKSHRVTEARSCPLAPAEFSEILNTLASFFKKHDLSVYDEESGTGLLRHVYLRRAEVTGEILLTLVINGTALPCEDELTALIRVTHPKIVGMLVNINTKDTNIILGDEYRTLFGRDYIVDVLSGVRLKITAPSFYQVNRSAAELLYAKARTLAALSPTDTLLDLFCGAGSIGLSMAADCAELIGIEIVESAVECAKFNANENGVPHAKFYTGDASATEMLLANAERELGRAIAPGVIILDPPRGGCDERLISFAASLAPKRIVYISCNPTTLARDCKQFKSLGYECGSVYPFDLFPMTGHVESVVCLTRGLDN